MTKKVYIFEARSLTNNKSLGYVVGDSPEIVIPIVRFETKDVISRVIYLLKAHESIQIIMKPMIDGSSYVIKGSGYYGFSYHKPSQKFLKSFWNKYSEALTKLGIT